MKVRPDRVNLVRHETSQSRRFSKQVKAAGKGGGTENLHRTNWLWIKQHLFLHIRVTETGNPPLALKPGLVPRADPYPAKQLEAHLDLLAFKGRVWLILPVPWVNRVWDWRTGRFRQSRVAATEQESSDGVNPGGEGKKKKKKKEARSDCISHPISTEPVASPCARRGH